MAELVVVDVALQAITAEPGTLDNVIQRLSRIAWWLGGFAGGAFGAALGALPVFIFTGFLVIAGEAANALPGIEAASITGQVAFGPVFGPHTSFAGGAAATAYAAKQGYIDAGFDYHEGKNILFALGTKPDVLIVGGLFGALGVLIRQVSFGLLLPWDPIALGVTLGALAHRLILGYSIIGEVRGNGVFDMTPFEREEMYTADTDDPGAPAERLAVEPWLPHQYKWANVATLGVVVGLAAGYLSFATGSPFLGFGISAATLLFLNCGVEQIPVTHHITLPASTAFLAVSASGDAVVSGVGVGLAMIVAAVFGAYGALIGEVHQRIFYAHGDTHWDPPAFAITVATLTIALLYMIGVFPTSSWVPALGV